MFNLSYSIASPTMIAYPLRILWQIIGTIDPHIEAKKYSVTIW